MLGLNGCRFRIDRNRLRFPGVSFGYGDSDPYLIAASGTGRFMVVRTPSVREWISIAHSAYFPARWALIETKKDGDGYRLLNTIREETPGRLWRRIRDELVQDMSNLDKS